MPLNFLLSASTVLRDTSFTDSHGSVKVSITPASDELILFMPIDDTNKNEKDTSNTFRKKYGLINKPICDLLIFYRKEKKIRFIFVETKGDHEDGAANQLQNTCNQFLKENDFKDYYRKLSEYFGTVPYDFGIKLLCVFKHTSTPQRERDRKLKEVAEKLKRQYNVSVNAESVVGKSSDNIASAIRE